MTEAAQAQIEQARDVLRADAMAASSDPGCIAGVLDSAIGRYAGARVLAFVGILVEREVANNCIFGTDHGPDHS